MMHPSYSVDSETTLTYLGKSYKASDVLAIVRKEDADAGRGVDDTETSVNTRRTKHCWPRALGLIVSNKHLPAFLKGRLQCSRQELDRKETGKNRGVWAGIAEDFRDKECKVSGGTVVQMASRTYVTHRWSLEAEYARGEFIVMLDIATGNTCSL